MNGSVKYRDKAAIWRVADEFRESADLRGHHIPPIDVIYIAEVILKLDVVPLPDLFAGQRIDAALLPDATGVYIDEDSSVQVRSDALRFCQLTFGFVIAYSARKSP